MDCPRCGQPDVTDAACPRCGVIFAKLRPPPRPPTEAPPSARPDPPGGSGRGVGRVVLEAAAVGVAVGIAFWMFRHPPAPPERKDSAPLLPPPSLAPPRTPPPAPMRIVVDRPPSALELPQTLPSAPPAKIDAEGIPEADVKAANALAERLQAKAPVSAADIETAEALFARYPKETSLKALAAELLIAAARQEQAQRRFAQAAAHLRRAAGVWPESPRPRLALMDVMLEASDWPAAEAAAREALGLDPRSDDALRGLGYALFRQDRNREAEEALRSSLELKENPWARNLLDSVQKQVADERGMTERKLARFNVRYDGDTHEDVGREILRVLDHHYATLIRVMDHEVNTPIPVILFSQQSYYDATGAPTWSGGQFSHLDGRIRIPIGGLTPSLTSDIDNVLIHELTHAFIADRSGGKAPREVHEGLAQYMEGKRISSLLTEEEARALADGRTQGVTGFYLGALSFVEYLIAQRGQGGMNDVLRAMSETGEVDEAFRRVYGRDYSATKAAWQQRFRQQQGS